MRSRFWMESKALEKLHCEGDVEWRTCLVRMIITGYSPEPQGLQTATSSALTGHLSDLKIKSGTTCGDEI